MAQLKDTTIQGSARVTDTLYSNAVQAKIFNIPTASNGTTYGPGTSGYVIKSNGTSVYWDSTGSGSVTSVRVQASSPLQSSTSTAQTSTLNTTISFVNQNANVVLAGPSSGSAAAPSFRALVAADIPSLDWSKIGSGKPTTLSGYGITDAAASSHTQAVNKGGTNITSYTIGDMLYASASTTLSKLAGNTTTTVKYLKSVATTSGTAVAPVWAQIAASEISGLGTMATANTGDYATSGHTQAVNKGGTNITSYTIGDILYASAATTLSKLAGNTTTTVKYLKSVATTSGTAVAPAWAQIAASEISGLGAAATKAVTDNSSNTDVTSTDTNLITGRTLYYQLAKKGYTTNTGTVTSVTLTSGSGITVSDSGTAITGSGSRTISITGMNTSSGSTSKCLTEKGTWASFTNNAGTVTSVQVQASGPLSSSTSTASSTTLSTTISFSNQDPNKVLAGPSSGSSAAAPTFRALVAADIPSLSWNKITSDKPTTLSGYGITDAATSGHTHSQYVLKTGDTMSGVLVANNFVSKYGVEFQNSSGTNVGGIFQDMEGANQFYMDEYTTDGVRECYLLPTPNATSTSFYDILTSKSAVTIAQGGTGATTAAGARTNLGLGSMAVASTADYVAKAGDTMTGSLTSPYFVTNVSEGSPVFDFKIANSLTTRLMVASNTNKLAFHEYTAGQTTVYEQYSLPTPDATENAFYNIYTEKNPPTAAAVGALPLSGGTMTGTITLNNGVAMNTASEAGWSMNQYGNFTHRRTNANDYVGVIGGSGDFRVYYDSGNVSTSGYIVGANGVYATNGILCTRGSTAWIQFQNASSQAIGEIWSQSGRIYIRERPSAGSSYYTDIVLPAAKTNGNTNKYVYTSDNFSLSGTTLTITVPS